MSPLSDMWSDMWIPLPTGFLSHGLWIGLIALELGIIVILMLVIPKLCQAKACVYDIMTDALPQLTQTRQQMASARRRLEDAEHSLRHLEQSKVGFGFLAANLVMDLLLNRKVSLDPLWESGAVKTD